MGSEPVMVLGEGQRKVVVLSLLTLHTSATSLVIHRSRHVDPSEELYSTTTSVFLGEVLKLFISLFLVSLTPSAHQISCKYDGKAPIWTRFILAMKQTVSQKDVWMMSIPAALYVVQNNLQLFALSNISPVTYQAMSQLKIVAVSVFSIMLLKRKMSVVHWAAIAVLLVGLMTVKANESPVPAVKTAVSSGISAIQNTSFLTASTVGTMTVVAAVTIGSLGGVILEKSFKEASSSMWISNAQLSIFSLFPAALLVLCELFGSSFTRSPLLGFGLWAWLTVFCRAAGGLLVALVLKYADNILKAYATSAAIILTLTITAITTQTAPSAYFIAGSSLVVISTYGFALADLHQKRKAQSQYLPIAQSPSQHLEEELTKNTSMESTSRTRILPPVLVDVPS